MHIHIEARKNICRELETTENCVWFLAVFFLQCNYCSSTFLQNKVNASAQSRDYLYHNEEKCYYYLAKDIL